MAADKYIWAQILGLHLKLTEEWRKKFSNAVPRRKFILINKLCEVAVFSNELNKNMNR